MTSEVCLKELCYVLEEHDYLCDAPRFSRLSRFSRPVSRYRKDIRLQLPNLVISASLVPNRRGLREELGHTHHNSVKYMQNLPKGINSIFPHFNIFKISIFQERQAALVSTDSESLPGASWLIGSDATSVSA